MPFEPSTARHLVPGRPRQFRLFLAAAALLPLRAVWAGDVLWTGQDPSSPFNWDLTVSNWKPGVWSNVHFDGAVFDSSGLGSSGSLFISVNVPITARSLEFITSGYTLVGTGPLTLTSLGTSSAGPATIEVLDGVIATVAVPLAGSDGLHKTGGGTLNLDSGSLGVSGPLVVDGGVPGPFPSSQLVLRGNAQWMAGAPLSVTVNNNAILTFDNVTNAINVPDRLPAGTPIELNGGRINFRGASGAGVQSGQDFGALTVTGLGVLTIGSGPGCETKLDFDSVTRVDNGTVLLGGRVAQPGTIHVTVTVGAGLPVLSDPLGPAGGQNTGIVPFIAAALANGATPPMQTFATFDAAGNQLRTLVQTDATVFNQVTAAAPAFAANRNNNLTTELPAPVTGTLRINSLAVSAPATVTGNGVLQIYSGAVVNSAPLAFEGPTIDFGSNTGYFHLGNSLSFGSAGSISGSAGVVVSGRNPGAASTLTLSNSSANSFTGGLFINGNATVAFSNANQLGAAGGGIILSGGTLSLYSLAATFDPGRIVKVGTTGGTLDVSSAAGLLTISGAVTGVGNLTKSGAGALVISGAGSLTGSVAIAGGELRLAAAGSLPTAAGFTVADGARLQIDDSLGSPGRLGASARVALNGGEFRLDGSAAASASQSFGALSFSGLGGTVSLNPGAGQAATLTAGGCSNSGFAVFRGTNLGGTSGTRSQVFLTGQTPGLIAGALADSDPNGIGTDQAYYDPIVGVRALRSSDLLPGALICNSAGTPLNADFLAAGPVPAMTGIGSEDNRINSLTVAGGMTVSVSNRLSLTAGVLNSDSGAAASVTDGGGAALDMGSGAARFLLKSDLTLVVRMQAAGPLLKAGPGTLVLSKPASYSGQTAVLAGALRLGANDVLPVSTDLIVRSGAVFDAGGFTATVASTGGDGNWVLGAGSRLIVAGPAETVLTGSLSGTGTLQVNGGRITLAGASPGFAGTLRLAGGYVTAAGPGSLGSASVVFAGNSELELDTAGACSNPLSFQGGSIWFINHGIGVSGTTTLTPLSGGSAGATMWLSGSGNHADVFSLASGASFVGTVVVSNTVAAVRDDSAFGNAGNALILDGVASETTKGGIRFDRSLSSSRSVTLTSASHLDVSAATDTVRLTGPIDGGGGALYKSGGGTLILGGPNSFSGELRVLGGRLQYDGSLTAGDGVFVHAGGTLSGVGTIGRDVSIAAGGHLAPGNGAGTGPLTIDGLLTAEPGATFEFTLSAGGFAPLVIGPGGALVLGSPAGCPELHLLLPDGFTADSHSIVFLVDNQGLYPIDGTFAAGPDGVVDLGAYAAHISYTADMFGSLTDGIGIALYDFAAVPVPEPSWLLAVILPGMLWKTIGRRRRGD